MSVGIIESFFVIFTGAAALAAFALYTRQPLIVAYILVGCAFGPHGMTLVADDRLLAEIGEIGIIFLLFLVGLDLPPSKLKDMIGESVLTALASSTLFFGIELVEDRATKAPASARTKQVVDAMRRKGVLMSNIGEHGNVLKLRPPLCFSKENADLLASALDEALAQ